MTALEVSLCILEILLFFFQFHTFLSFHAYFPTFSWPTAPPSSALSSEALRAGSPPGLPPLGTAPAATSAHSMTPLPTEPIPEWATL